MYVQKLQNLGLCSFSLQLFFEKSQTLIPQKKSSITLQDVDEMLTELSQHTKEDDQQRVLTKIAKK